MNIIYLLLLVLFSFYAATAQPLTLRRIPSVQEPIDNGQWLSFNSKPVLVGGDGTLYAYNDSSRQWTLAEGLPSASTEMHATPSGSTYIVYRSGSTSEIDVLEYKSDGTTSPIPKHPLLLARGPAPAVIYAQNSLFVVGCTPLKNKLVAAQYQSGKWTMLDTLDVVNPQSIMLYRNPSQHQVFMTITEVDSMFWSTSRSLRRTPASGWVSHSPVLKGFRDGVQLGSHLFVPVSEKLFTADSGYTSFTVVPGVAADYLLHLDATTMIAYCANPDSLGARMYITRDGGANFQRIQSVANIPDRIRSLVRSANGTIYFSTAAIDAPYALGLYSLADTVVTRITPPTQESQRAHSRLTPIRQSPGMFFTLPLAIEDKYDSCIYDITKARWKSLVDSNGRTLRVTTATSGTNHSIIYTDWGAYILQGRNLHPLPIRDTARVATFKIPSQSVFLSDNVALVLDGLVNTWYRVNLSNGIATMVDSDWLTELVGCRRKATGVCLLDASSSTIAVGVEDYWNIGTDSLSGQCNRYGVLISRDTGTTWTMMSEGFGQSNYCWDVQSRNGTLFALMSAAFGPWEKNRASIYRREPGGVWQQTAALPVDMVNPMRLHVQPSGTVYACNKPIVRSLDNGDTWEVLQTDLPDNTTFSAVIEVGNNLVISTGRYVYIAENAISSISEHVAETTTNAIWDGTSFVIPDSDSVSDTPTEESFAYGVDGRQIMLLRSSHRMLQPMQRITPGVYIVRVGQRYYRSFVY